MTDVIAYPSHFEVPRAFVAPDRNTLQPDVPRRSPVEPVGATTRADGKYMTTSESGNLDTAHRAFGDDRAPPQDTLEDFKNVYIARPAPVMFHDSSGVW